MLGFSLACSYYAGSDKHTSFSYFCINDPHKKVFKQMPQEFSAKQKENNIVGPSWSNSLVCQTHIILENIHRVEVVPSSQEVRS